MFLKYNKSSFPHPPPFLSQTLLVNFQESWKQLKSRSPLTQSVITDLKSIWEDIGQIIDRK